MEKPPIQKEFGEIERRSNRILIKRFGSETEVGRITLLTETKPIPHYYAHWLWVSGKEQGKGFASQLLGEVEKISREAKMPIILIDDIKKSNSEAMGMYGRRIGWVEIPNAKQWRSAYVYGASAQQAAEFQKFYSSPISSTMYS